MIAGGSGLRHRGVNGICDPPTLTVRVRPTEPKGAASPLAGSNARPERQNRLQDVSGFALGLVLFAAVLHAGWNAIAKHIPSRLAASTSIGLAYLAAGVVGLLIPPLPAAPSWPYLALSACLQTAYLILLTSSYRLGDFSQLYPLARGLAVVGVSIVSVAVLGEQLSTVQLIGVGVIAGALIALTFTGSRSGNRRGIGLAVLTAICIAAYTIIDGLGVRRSGAPLGYAAALFLLQGMTLPLTCLGLSSDPRNLAAELRRHWRLGCLGGVMSLVAYAIVVWAQNQVSLALVAALRETSVLLAGVLGWIVFGERLSPVRTLLTIAAVGGWRRSSWAESPARLEHTDFGFRQMCVTVERLFAILEPWSVLRP
jgi:drug/metabolite transporter (DMT)-like permease